MEITFLIWRREGDYFFTSFSRDPCEDSFRTITDKCLRHFYIKPYLLMRASSQRKQSLNKKPVLNTDFISDWSGGERGITSSLRSVVIPVRIASEQSLINACGIFI